MCDESMQDPSTETGRTMSKDAEFDGFELDMERNGKANDKTSKLERKKSKKLKAKWEQVKKVFQGKQEPTRKLDRSGTVTAKELLNTNSRMKTRNFSVIDSPDVCALDLFSEKSPKQSPAQLEQSSPGSMKSDPANLTDGILCSNGESLLEAHSDSKILTRTLSLKQLDHGKHFSDIALRSANTFIFPETVNVQNFFKPTDNFPYVDEQKSSPLSLSPTDGPTFGRSNSFRIPKVISQSKDSLSKSVPSSPVQLVFSPDSLPQPETVQTTSISVSHAPVDAAKKAEACLG